ncbi:Protein of unknown function [Spirosomataceae bacterium TFI 002]|nr:Protein of unknown function [Spirosomataceae bacterium TFI 002]
MKHNLEEMFIQNILHSFDENLIWIEIAASKLSETDIWEKPNEQSNSIGILCQHLSGNITQYIIAGLGKTPDKRARIYEFQNTPQFSSLSPLDLLKSTVENAKSVISELDFTVLYEEIAVQGIKMTGFQILQHVTQHLFYHSGQIVYLRKLLKNQDLDLYAGRDLNKLN